MTGSVIDISNADEEERAASPHFNNNETVFRQKRNKETVF